MATLKPSPLLSDLLTARSPSGFEQEAQAVLDKRIPKQVDGYRKDTLGSRIATLNPKGDPILLFSGHIDEIGFIIKYVDEKGFLYFDTLGGHDRVMLAGRRVVILTEKGPVLGVTGKRAIHLMDQKDREKVPQLHEFWIDIAAKDQKDALKRISIGDPAVYDTNYQQINGSVYAARAFDDKIGAYTVFETISRLAKSKDKLNAKVISVGSAQEEVGLRGAQTATYGENPHIGIAVDVGHATDHPDCIPAKHGKYMLGKGPIIARGPNINPFVFKRLTQVAEKLKIPYQIGTEARPTGTDANVIQMTKKGVAAGLISVPLRYMHTPSETLDLNDAENSVNLLIGFAKSLKKSEYGVW